MSTITWEKVDGVGCNLSQTILVYCTIKGKRIVLEVDVDAVEYAYKNREELQHTQKGARLVLDMEEVAELWNQYRAERYDMVVGSDY